MHGMCSQQRRDSRVEHDSKDTMTLVRSPNERVTNADREAAANLLRAAFSDGILHVEEFDQRLAAAYAARLGGDLEAVTADLPSDWRSSLAAQAKAERRAEAHRRYWRAEFRAYVGVMALLVSIWLLTSVGDAEGLGHPWPIWPALGWGLSLFLTRPRGAIANAVRRWSVAGAR